MFAVFVFVNNLLSLICLQYVHFCPKSALLVFLAHTMNGRLCSLLLFPHYHDFLLQLHPVNMRNPPSCETGQRLAELA